MIWALLSERLGVTSHPVWPTPRTPFGRYFSVNLKKQRRYLAPHLGVTPQYPVTVTVTSSQKWSPKRNRHQASSASATTTPRSTGSNRAGYALRSGVTV